MKKLILFLIISIGYTSCKKADDPKPVQCYECTRTAYYEDNPVQHTNTIKCTNDIQAYIDKHTGWDDNYYYKMECE